MKIIDDILKAEKRADELMEKAQGAAEDILKQGKAEEAKLFEKGRKDLDLHTSETIKNITKTSMKKVKEEINELSGSSKESDESSRKKISKLAEDIVKKVEKL